jgi:hypothetical protein
LIPKSLFFKRSTSRSYGKIYLKGRLKMMG